MFPPFRQGVQPPPPVLQTPFRAVLDVANFFLEENPSTSSSFTTTNSLTVAPGDNFLAVIISPYSSLTFTLVSVSWNGNPLTFYARGTNPPIYQDGEIWYLPNPPPGTGTLTIVATAALGGFSYVVGFPCSGVDLTRPFGTFATKPINASNAYPVSLSVPGVGPADIAIAWSDGNVNKLYATGGQIELGQHNGGSAGYFPAGIFNPGSTAIFQWAWFPGSGGTNNNNINTGVVIRGGATWSGSPPTAPMRRGPRLVFPPFVQGLPPSGGGPVTNFLTLTAAQAEALSFGPTAISAIRSISQAASLILLKAITSSQPGATTQPSAAAISKAIAHLFGAVAQSSSSSMARRNVGVVRTITQAESMTIAKAITTSKPGSVSQATTATLIKSVAHALGTVTQATVAALAKSVGKLFSAIGQATSATLTAIKVHLLTLTVTQATTATLARALAVIRSISQASSPSLKKSVGLPRSQTQATSAMLAKTVGIVRAIAQATVATLTSIKVHMLTLSVTQATAATLVKSAGIARAASQAAATAFKKACGIVRNPTQATSPSLAKAIRMTRAIAQANSTTLLRGLVHLVTLATSVTSSATLRKLVGVLRLSAIVNAATVAWQHAAHVFLGVPPASRTVNAREAQRMVRTEAKSRVVRSNDSTARTVRARATSRVAKSGDSTPRNVR